MFRKLFYLTLCTMLMAGCGRLGFSPSFEPSSDAEFAQFDAAFSTQADAGQADAGQNNGNTKFCSSMTPAPAFCEDFDGPTPTWSQNEMNNMGSISTDALSAVSLPGSRRVVMASVPANDPCQYVFERRILNTPAASTVRIEYQLRLGHLNEATGVPQTRDVHITGFSTSGANGSGGCDFYPSIGPALGVLLTVYPQDPRGTDVTFPLSRVLTPMKWTHVAFEVTATNGVGRVSAWLDGTAVLTDAAISNSPRCDFGLLQRVGNGLYCYGGSNDIEFRVDNMKATVR